MPSLPEGRVLDVVRAPAPVLATPGADVDPGAAEVVQLAADLLATQAVSPGCVGLAAQQVGVAWRMFSVDVSGHPKTRTCHGEFVLCNAVVESASRKEKGREGCMSVPDFTGDVARARRLVVRGQLPVTGEWVTLETDGLPRSCRRPAGRPPASHLPLVSANSSHTPTFSRRGGLGWPDFVTRADVFPPGWARLAGFRHTRRGFPAGVGSAGRNSSHAPTFSRRGGLSGLRSPAARRTKAERAAYLLPRDPVAS